MYLVNVGTQHVQLLEVKLNVSHVTHPLDLLYHVLRKSHVHQHQHMVGQTGTIAVTATTLSDRISPTSEGEQSASSLTWILV